MARSAEPPGLLGGFTVSLPFAEDAARTARSMVGRLLSEQGCPDRLIEDGRLVTHELVVNGVMHGAPDDRSELEVVCQVFDAHVLISVLDAGSRGVVAVRPDSGHRSHGRGLAIVAALAHSWSVDRQRGTRVSARLSR